MYGVEPVVVHPVKPEYIVPQKVGHSLDDAFVPKIKKYFILSSPTLPLPVLLAESNKESEESLLLPGDGGLVTVDLRQQWSVLVLHLEVLADHVTYHHLGAGEALDNLTETFLVLTPQQVAKQFLEKIHSRFIHQLRPLLS